MNTGAGSFEQAWSSATACWADASERGHTERYADVPPLARAALQHVPDPSKELVWDVATMIGFSGIHMLEHEQNASGRQLIDEALSLIVAQREKDLAHVLDLPIAAAKPLMDEIPIHPHYKLFLSYAWDDKTASSQSAPKKRRGFFRR